MNDDIKVTNHVIIRRYERYHKNNEIFDNNKLTQEIIDEFYKSKLIKKDKIKGDVYKSDKNTIIASSEDLSDEVVIITIYPNKDVYKTQEKIILDKNNIIENKKLVEKILISDDLIILKHMGSKKILLLNNLVVLARIEENKGKVYINIVKKWAYEKFKDLKFLDDFKQEYFTNESEVLWIKFLQSIGVYNIVYYKQNNIMSQEVRIFQKVLSGEFKRFPSNFWKEEENATQKYGAIQITKYLFEEILKWEQYEIIQKARYAIFKQYKLSGMIHSLYDGSASKAINDAYPNIMPWKLKHLPCQWFWKDLLYRKNDSIKFKRWILKELKQLGYNLKADKSLLSYDWEKIMVTCNTLSFITYSCNKDMNLFFKNLFEVDFSEQEIANYQYKFSNKTKEINIYR